MFSTYSFSDNKIHLLRPSAGHLGPFFIQKIACIFSQKTTLASPKSLTVGTLDSQF